VWAYGCACGGHRRLPLPLPTGHAHRGADVPIRRRTGYFPVGCAALHGFLKQVPAGFLTQQNLRYECPSTGWNLLHFAAKGRSLKQVPQDLLTDSNLRQLNPRCGSVLHVAASAGCLDQVPSDVLHYENLLLPDEKERRQPAWR